MEQPFSFDAYRKKFDDYAAGYDQSDGRVALKIIHTHAVVSIMEQLCRERRLPGHIRNLALLCALFHDIGRFEQLLRYHTFLDHKSIDHAALSCQVLLENAILDDLSPTEREWILTAIRNHNRLEIEDSVLEGENEPLELTRLLRDADKCDIFRVFAVDHMEDVIGVPDETVAKGLVSPDVLAKIRHFCCVDKKIRKTYLDYWISFLGFFFDLNYAESAAIARKQGYYRVPFDRVSFCHQEARQQVDEALRLVEDYADRLQADTASLEMTHSSFSECIPETLSAFFRAHPKVALAFSGGTDSAYLLYAARACGCRVRAYYVSTQFQPAFELEDAKRLALELGADLKILPLDVLSSDTVRNNPSDRCYYCKHTIFQAILRAASEDGWKEIIDGTNASDDAKDRPGMRALRELKVLSPLRRSKITKKALREYSRNANLFTWDKPAYACLATRIPTGTKITAEILKKVEWSEAALSSMGFSDFRVRVLPDEKSKSWAAKLQLTESQLPLLMEHRKTVFDLLSKEFADIFLDLNARPVSS